MLLQEVSNSSTSHNRLKEIWHTLVTEVTDVELWTACVRELAINPNVPISVYQELCTYVTFWAIDNPTLLKRLPMLSHSSIYWLYHEAVTQDRKDLSFSLENALRPHLHGGEHPIVY